VETSEIHSALQHTIDTLKIASADQFRIYTNNSEIAFKEIEIAELPFYQQLAHILVSGEDLELNFKTHFMLDDVKGYTTAKLKSDIVSTNQITDFIKEYCNLVAGKAKLFLEEQRLVVGQSLPYAIQGFNEMFYPKTNGYSKDNAWELTGPLGSIRCSCTIRLFKTPAVTALKNVQYTNQFGRESGEVELF
jgi:hypothetical protein